MYAPGKFAAHLAHRIPEVVRPVSGAKLAPVVPAEAPFS